MREFINVESITINGYPRITDDSIRRIINNSPDIRRIFLEKTAATVKTVKYALDVTKIRKSKLSLKVDLSQEHCRLEGDILCEFELHLF